MKPLMKYEEAAAEDARRWQEVMKDAHPDDIISSFDTFPASYVNVSKLERERAATQDGTKSGPRN